MTKMAQYCLFFFSILAGCGLICNSEPEWPSSITATPTISASGCTDYVNGEDASCFCRTDGNWQSQHNGQIISNALYQLKRYCFLEGNNPIDYDSLCLLADTLNPFYKIVLRELYKEDGEFQAEHLTNQLNLIFEAFNHAEDYSLTELNCDSIPLCSLVASIVENLAYFDFQWNLESRLPNSEIRLIFINETKWYAVTDNTLYISLNSGLQWSPITFGEGIEESLIHAVRASGNAIYVGKEDGLSITLDGSTSWQMFHSETPGFGGDVVKDIYLDNGIIYVATSYGLSYSNQMVFAFNTFTKENTGNGLGDNTINTVFALDSKIYAGTPSGLYVLDKSNNTWTSYNSDTTEGQITDNDISEVYATSSTMYLATASGLFVSDSPYILWRLYAPSTTDDKILSGQIEDMYTDGNVILLATPAGVSVSFDNGASWMTYTQLHGLPSNSISAVAYYKESMYAGTSDGLATSAMVGPLKEINSFLTNAGEKNSSLYQETFAYYAPMINLNLDKVYSILSSNIKSIDTALTLSDQLLKLYTCDEPPCVGEGDSSFRQTVSRMVANWFLTSKRMTVINAIVSIFQSLHGYMGEDGRDLLEYLEPQMEEIINGWLTERYSCSP